MRYYWSALVLLVFGVIALWALSMAGLVQVWVPLTVLGFSSWIAAGVLTLMGRAVVDSRGGGGLLQGGLALCVGVLAVFGLFVLFAAALSAAEFP